MIDQATIDRIMDAARIEEVIGEFVTLRKRGLNYIGLCPFHDEKTPSFSVSPTKGICKCFSCGKGGNVVHFIMEHEQLSFFDALKWLAKKYNIEIVERELTSAEQKTQNDRESMFILNEYAREYYSDILHKHFEGKSIGMGYFIERGFREDIIKKFQLGYSIDQKDAFSKEAIAKGYKKDFLLKTGLSLESEQKELRDRYRARVMFPVHTLSGKVVAFGGRILKKDDKTAKYINSPESEIYHKSNELYGIYFAKQSIAKNDRCYLVEGYTDVISMHQAGIENVVASSGTALTHGQIRMIHRFTNNVTVLYDGDAAGIKASLKGINLLLEEGLNVRVLLLPDGEDPDSFSKKHNASDFSGFIKENETDFIRFKTEILLKDAGNDPVAKAHLIQDIVESISLISDDITRSVYTKECSNLLEIGEDLLRKEVDKKRMYREQKKNDSSVPGGYNSSFNRSGRDSGSSFETRNNGLDSSTVNPPEGFVPDFPPSGQSDYGKINPLAPEKKEDSKNQKFDKVEGNLLKFVILYGTKDIFKKETDENGLPSINVLQFLRDEINRESIVLRNPMYNKMISEAFENCDRPGFIPEIYFINHHDPQVSLTAASLITEQYQLSKYHSRNQLLEDESAKLDDLIPRLMLDLKFTIIQEEIFEIQEKLKKASESGNEADILEYSRQLIDYQEIKKDLAKNTGERIILNH